jgi:hypothetical protein
MPQWMSLACVMHNRCGDLFGPGSLGQDKALVEIAAIQRLPELSKASRNQEHPDPLEIAKEALVAKRIVSLDQVECRLHPLKDKRVLVQKEPADPKAFNTAASRQAEREPIEQKLEHQVSGAMRIGNRACAWFAAFGQQLVALWLL